MLTKIIYGLTFSVVLVFDSSSISFAAPGDFLVDQMEFCISKHPPIEKCPRGQIVTRSVRFSDLPIAKGKDGKMRPTIFFWAAINAADRVTDASLEEEVQVRFSRVGPCADTTQEDVETLKGEPDIKAKLLSGEYKQTAEDYHLPEIGEFLLAVLNLTPLRAVKFVKYLDVGVAAGKALPSGKHEDLNRWDFRQTECPDTDFGARLFDKKQGVPLPGRNEGILIHITK
jgi:hypothetical protein